MQITIFGSGYVGLVTGACLAEVGNHVVCVDIDEDKIRRLNEGDVPIYEPGLDDYIERNVEAGRLEFTTSVARAVEYDADGGFVRLTVLGETGHEMRVVMLDGNQRYAPSGG